MSANKILNVAILVAITQVFTIIAMDAKCKGVDINMTEQQIMGIKECAASAGITSKDNIKPEQVACMSKCIMEKKGLVDDKGKPHKENIMKFIDAAMPDVAKADLKAATEKCLDTDGAKINPADATCMSYHPLAMCMHGAFVNLCK